jgi:hypothetical protein
MDKEIINWLLEGPDWLQYAVKSQLLDSKPNTELALKDGFLAQIIHRLKDQNIGFPALISGNLSYTGGVYWDLFFLADIGLTIMNLKIKKEIEEILNLQLPDGTFVTWREMKPHYFCISSILMSAIVKMDFKDDPRIKKYLQVILESQRLDGGWHCAKSRARGRKLQNTESCPMDNLNILNLFGQYDKYRDDPRFNGAIDLLLDHWDRKDEKWRPYGFGIGTQFTRLKYPAVKYGILRVLDALSLFPYAIKSESFKDMLDFVHEKSSDGKYFAESFRF